MKVHENKSKNGIVMNVGVSVENLMIGDEKCYMWNPNTCGCECNKASKIDGKLFMRKCLIGKLVLGCEDEILNTTETSPDDVNM